MVIPLHFPVEKVTVNIPSDAEGRRLQWMYLLPPHEVLFRQIHMVLYERGELQGNIVDLGAFLGDNGVPWGMVMPEKTIYSIDPCPGNCEFIRRMIECNSSVSNVKIIQSAISDKEEVLNTNDDLMHCSFVWNSGHNTVKATTLDKLFQDGELKDLGYIHLDVEGMEYQVLRGSENIINTFRPIFTVEQHIEREKDSYALIRQFFNERKYIMYMINEVAGGFQDCRNFFAFPEEKHSDETIKAIQQHIGAHNFTKV